MLKIYNDLTQNKEEFIPLEKNKVKMYVCGPTVYDNCHIGHARSFIAFDVIRRYLIFLGYSVTYVLNFTDIDDKMINRANQENISVFQLAERYIKSYFEDVEKLNIKKADYHPRATVLIPEMIKIIEKLVEKKHAYISDGDVYFDIESFENYGKLSRVNLEESASKLDDEKKKNPHDFALWKAKKEGEPSWNSPWGEGRPGWHIECSAMSFKLLGETIDIHGGGRDLIFPHHENEIVQSESFTGKKFVNFWMHNGFVTIDKEKMSKSLGNFFTIKEVLQKFSPKIVRFFLISSQYRNPIDYSEENLLQAERTYERIANAVEITRQIVKIDKKILKNSKQFKNLLQETRERFIDAMDDDFNTPKAISILLELVKEVNKLESLDEIPSETDMNDCHQLFLELGGILGLSFETEIEDNLQGALIELLIEIRNEIRSKKMFDLSDKIRDDLKKLGIELLDSKDGTRWKSI